MNTTPIDYKIEFMAWNKRHKQLLGGIPLNRFESNMINVENYGDGFGFDDVMYWYLDDIELMQRTALRSINYEPIYNHMIVKDEWGYHFVVDMFDYWKMWGLAESKLEIVGNRFQHPELLELCK